MKKIISATLAASLLFMGAANAAPPASAFTAALPISSAPSGAAIGWLKVAAGMDVVTVEAGIHYGNWEMTKKAAIDGEKALDDAIGDAVKAAAGHPDLLAAVKAYYVAGKTYFENAWSDPTSPAIVVTSNEARLKADMDSKASAMELEAKLAGL